MPLVRINATGDRPCPVDDLDAALAAHRPGARIVVLIHGYKFSPLFPERCPHGHILSLAPRPMPRAVSWPRHLGFGRGDPDEGLCIAFGWHARGPFPAACREARVAGRALSALIARLAAKTGTPVDIVCHSLGARVALSAFAGLPARTVRRVLLLAAAETRSRAEAALATPAGRTAEVVNVRTRENALFDVLFRTLASPGRPLDRTLGAGLGRPEARWLDLCPDAPATRARLDALGFRVAPRARRVCHWSAYLRPGLFAVYRALLAPGGRLPLARLAAPEPPQRVRNRGVGLPFPRKAPIS